MDFEKITEYLESLKQRQIPCADCIITQNHQVIYRHMFGASDALMTKPLQGNEKYLMFSMTKVQTMTAFMQLVEQGKISLDDNVADYLPAFGKLTVEKDGRVEPLNTPMKIWHLLSMQSGLDYDLQRPGIVRVLKERGMQATTREIVDSFTESPLKFVPGEHFMYSLSHDVAAAIIEVVSGMSFGEYLKKNIWEPLGMTNTRFAKPMNDDVKDLAQQYILDDTGKVVTMEQSCNYQLSEAYESGGAGLMSCTEDYAIFGDMLACGGVGRNGARILKPETIDVIKTNLLGENGKKDVALTMGRVGYGYGCGMQILLDPDAINSKAAKGIFGWDGAAASMITMDTASGISIVFITHVRNCGYAYSEIHPALRDLVFAL